MDLTRRDYKRRNYRHEDNTSGWVKEEKDAFEDDLTNSPDSYGQIRPRENSIISISQDSSSDSQVSDSHLF